MRTLLTCPTSIQVIPCSPLKSGKAASSSRLRASTGASGASSAVGMALGRRRTPAPSPNTSAQLQAAVGGAFGLGKAGVAAGVEDRAAAKRKAAATAESLESFSGLYLTRRAVSDLQMRRSMRGRQYRPLKQLDAELARISASGGKEVSCRGLHLSNLPN